MDRRADIAIVVLAHANPMAFERMTAALSHPNIALFVHVDAKADIDMFRPRAHGQVTFLKDRFSIGWGAYSMIEAELALLRVARAAGPFAAYALISGDSLPLLENAALIDILTSGANFLPGRELGPADKNFPRFERIYLPDTTIGQFRNKGYIERYLDPADLPLIGRAIQSRASGFHKTLRYWKASQWFAISDGRLESMLNYLARTPQFEEVFRFSAIPDESFFPTLLRIVCPKPGVGHFFMDVDWTRPQRPYTLTSDEDYAGVANSEGLFYRKFSDQGLKLVDKVLANRISNQRRASEPGQLRVRPESFSRITDLS